MSRKARGLTPDEKALWSKVTEQATPLHPERPAPLAEQIEQRAKPKPAREPVPEFRVGERSETALPHNLAPTLAVRLQQQPVAMDRRTYDQVKRGKRRPEGRIDLHGMTLAQAHPALTRFLFDSHAKDRRLVLVITGKGKDKDGGGPIPVRRGVLKHQVPHWLETPPLNQLVLQVAEANLKHGGSGAYYVYLKRRR